MKVAKGQKLWLSKYALSDGIGEVVVRSDQDESKYVFLVGHYSCYTLGRDVHLTKSGALVAAEALRIKKIGSLKKQIAKLEKLSFAAESQPL